MTSEELKRLREICEKATSGPWKFNDVNRYTHTSLENEKCYIIEADDFRFCIQPNDAEFITEARSALPALIDEVERLRSLQDGETDWHQLYTNELNYSKHIQNDLGDALEHIIKLKEDISKWKEEYENVCKFANEYEEELSKLKEKTQTTFVIRKGLPMPSEDEDGRA